MTDYLAHLQWRHKRLRNAVTEALVLWDHYDNALERLAASGLGWEDVEAGYAYKKWNLSVKALRKMLDEGEVTDGEV